MAIRRCAQLPCQWGENLEKKGAEGRETGVKSAECRIRYYKSGTEGRRHKGTQARSHEGTKARRHAGTKARRHSGAQALRHSGTQALKQAGAATRAMRPMAAPHRRHRAVSGNKWYCVHQEIHVCSASRADRGQTLRGHLLRANSSVRRTKPTSSLSLMATVCHARFVSWWNLLAYSVSS